MRKYLFILIMLTGLLSVRMLNAQPPPPPPDPNGPTTDPYPPGWVGKSPVGDGISILIALGLAYSLKKYLDYRKKSSSHKQV